MAFGLFKKEKPITEMTLEYYTYAAEGGHRRAPAACASCYENGIGCDKNIEKSLEWLGKFAENGTPEEQLAQIVEKQRIYAGDTSAELAQELGYPDTDAMFTQMYLELASKSEEEYKQAIDEFHKKKQPLGASCYKDPYVSRMRESVLYYHEKLADSGHSSSCAAIAKQLYSDYKTTDDPRKLEESAEMIIRAQSAGEIAKCYAKSLFLIRRSRQLHSDTKDRYIYYEFAFFWQSGKRLLLVR